MDIGQQRLQIDRSASDQISQAAQSLRILSLLSLASAILCLPAMMYGNFGKEWLAPLIIGGVLLLCTYYLLREFAAGISRGAWVLANAPPHKMWLKKGIWSSDLYTEADASDPALRVIHLYKIKQPERAMKGTQDRQRIQRSEVIVQSDCFLDGSSIIRSDDEVIIGAVSKSALIPGFSLLGIKLQTVGPKQHLIKAESHLWALLIIPGTFAFLMSNSLAYSLLAQGCLAATILLAFVLFLDLPMKAIFARSQKEILEGKSEKYLEYRLNHLAVMCLRYRKNPEVDVINKILLARKTGSEACRTASTMLAEHLKSEKQGFEQNSVSVTGTLCLLSALMFAGMAHIQSRVHQGAYLAPYYAKSSLQLKMDEMDGTLKGSAIAINFGKDGEGVRIRMRGSALAQGLIDHPHVTLTSTGSINQSQTEYIALNKDVAGDWAGESKKVPLHAVGPLSLMDYFEKQLTVAVKADVLKSGKGDVILDVSPLNSSLASAVQFSEDVTTEDFYKAAPMGITKQIPIVLYPQSTVYVDKYLDATFTAFSNKAASGLPQVLAYYNKELKREHWKTYGVKAQKGVEHVSFCATKGNRRLNGDAWGYDNYCKIDFEIDFDEKSVHE